MCTLSKEASEAATIIMAAARLLVDEYVLKLNISRYDAACLVADIILEELEMD